MTCSQSHTVLWLCTLGQGLIPRNWVSFYGNLTLFSWNFREIGLAQKENLSLHLSWVREVVSGREEILPGAWGSHWVGESCELLVPKTWQSNGKQPWLQPGDFCCNSTHDAELEHPAGPSECPQTLWSQMAPGDSPWAKGQSVSGGRGGWRCCSCPQELPQAGFVLL